MFFWQLFWIKAIAMTYWSCILLWRYRRHLLPHSLLLLLIKYARRGIISGFEIAQRFIGRKEGPMWLHHANEVLIVLHASILVEIAIRISICKLH